MTDNAVVSTKPHDVDAKGNATARETRCVLPQWSLQLSIRTHESTQPIPHRSTQFAHSLSAQCSSSLRPHMCQSCVASHWDQTYMLWLRLCFIPATYIYRIFSASIRLCYRDPIFTPSPSSFLVPILPVCYLMLEWNILSYEVHKLGQLFDMVVKQSPCS